VERLAEFARHYALRLTLLSDRPSKDGTPRTMAAYGAWGAKSLYGRTYTGVIRSTYILDPSGRVAARFRNVRVTGHADRVVRALQEIFRR
jgi:peroxiredoxin Q/BCP